MKRDYFEERKRKAEIGGLAVSFGLTMVVFTIVALITFANPHNEYVEIQSIDKISKTSGDSESFYTDVYYMVYTDQGTFRASLDGLNHCRTSIGKMEEGKSYHLFVRGARIQLLGFYPNIIEAR